MVAILLLTLFQTPQPPPAQPVPPTTTTPAPKPRPAAPASNLTLTFFVTDSAGKLLRDVTVTLTGPVDRELKTPGDSGLRITGLRSGTYRARFVKDGYQEFEREIRLRGSDEIPVTLNAAPPPPPPPTPTATPTPAPTPAPAPTAAQTPAPSTAGKLPPRGTPKTMSLPDFIEQNFISNREPQKESIVGCSGAEQALVWQVREPWDGRQHESADAMLYVIGGEGSVKIDGREISVTAGSFAVVPRGTPYGFTRRGRNPLIVLAILAGAPCAAE